MFAGNLKTPRFPTRSLSRNKKRLPSKILKICDNAVFFYFLAFPATFKNLCVHRLILFILLLHSVVKRHIQLLDLSLFKSTSKG